MPYHTASLTNPKSVISPLAQEIRAVFHEQI